MGDWIKYRHRTKDFKKLMRLVEDVRVIAENTGRRFRLMDLKGYSFDLRHDGDSRNDNLYNFDFVESLSDSFGSNPKPSKEIYFEFEMVPGVRDEDNWFGVGWHLRNGWWIANDGQKMYPTIPRERILESVLSVIGILEFIKKFYFPTFKIEDQMNFYVNWDDLTDHEKRHLHACSVGELEHLRRKDGTFKDYVAEYKSWKNHNLDNLARAVDEYDGIMGFIKSNLKSKGFKEDNFVKKDSALMRSLFPNKSVSGNIKEYVPSGNVLIERFHDTLSGILVENKRKRIIRLNQLKSPIRKVSIIRRDGVRQRYHKRLL